MTSKSSKSGGVYQGGPEKSLLWNAFVVTCTIRSQSSTMEYGGHGMDISVGFFSRILEEFRGSIGEGIFHTTMLFASLRAWRFDQNWRSTMRSVCGG